MAGGNPAQFVSWRQTSACPPTEPSLTMKSSGRFCRPYDLRQREQLLRLGPRLHTAPRRTVYVGRISGVEWIAEDVLCRRVQTGVADSRNCPTGRRSPKQSPDHDTAAVAGNCRSSVIEQFNRARSSGGGHHGPEEKVCPMSPVFRPRSPVASPRRIHSSPGWFNQRCRCWLRSTSQDSQQYSVYC